MQTLNEVQFIPATGRPEYAVVPYHLYVEMKERDSLALAKIAPSPPVDKTEGNPIKQWRLARGLSQSALAKLAQISIPYLSQLENNLRVGSKDVLIRIAQSLQVGIDQIL